MSKVLVAATAVTVAAVALLGNEVAHRSAVRADKLQRLERCTESFQSQTGTTRLMAQAICREEMEERGLL